MVMSPPATIEEPTSASSLAETQAYLEEAARQQRPIEVRRLIGFWGFKGRGKRIVQVVERDLERMGLETAPPFDVGPLSASVLIRGLSPKGSGETAPIPGAEDYLLTLARIPSAAFMLGAEVEKAMPEGVVFLSTEIDVAVTIMLRNDYSQLAVVDTAERRVILGAFSWTSYAQSRLQDERPKVVGDAMQKCATVPLYSDLLASLGLVVDEGFVLVSYEGRLAGIVTVGDVSKTFEALALPFLAVGRCEQELKRVAREKFPETSPEKIDRMMQGQLMDLFRNNWALLNWSLSRELFMGWLDEMRQLRNTIAHYDDVDQIDPRALDGVHRLTKWLGAVRTSEKLEVEAESKSS